MLSAPAAQIQTVAASAWVKETPNHGLKPNYSQVMAIVMSIVFTAVAILTACGKERLGSHFELARRAGAEENLLAGKVTTVSEEARCAAEMELSKSGCVHREDV